MFAIIEQADLFTWLLIFLKAVTYLTTLSAIGSVIVIIALRRLPSNGHLLVRNAAMASAIVAAFFTILRLPMHTVFLMGGAWDGTLDPLILQMVIDSPLGMSAALRITGLCLVMFVGWRGRLGVALAVLGALFAATSFSLRGHSLNDPRLILGALVTLHILCISFWIAAIIPLLNSAKSDPPRVAGILAQEFGIRAVWAVALLIISGGAVLAVLGSVSTVAFESEYGQFFLIKLLLFVIILSISAANKLYITPPILDSKIGYVLFLKRSIYIESVFLFFVLIITATLTTTSSPPNI